MNTELKIAKNLAAQKPSLQRPNLKSFDGGTLPVFVLRRKFSATAISRLFRLGDGDYDNYRTA